MPQALTPEQHAREQIDDMLRQAGWAVQSARQMSLRLGTGVAVRDCR
jgi:type I restriction enzyme R subunit